MSDISETIEDAKIEAMKNGCEVVGGDDHCLLLDFDTIDAKKQYERMRHKVVELWGIEREETWMSKSKHPAHQHMRVTLGRPLIPAERVALQAALGSDPMREMFAVRRLNLGIAEPSLLFRPKDAEIQVWPLEIEPIGTPISDEWEDIF